MLDCFVFASWQVGIQLGGLESTEPARFSAGLSTNCRSILDFTMPNTTRPTPSSGVPAAAAKASSAEIQEDNLGAAQSLTSVVSSSISPKAGKRRTGDCSRRAKLLLTFL